MRRSDQSDFLLVYSTMATIDFERGDRADIRREAAAPDRGNPSLVRNDLMMYVPIECNHQTDVSMK